MRRSLISLEAGLTPMPGEWCRMGSCRSYPTAWWYPFESDQRTQRERDEDAEVATRICRELCPVRHQCLGHAMRYREAGIWGGTSEQDRKNLRRCAV